MGGTQPRRKPAPTKKSRKATADIVADVKRANEAKSASAAAVLAAVGKAYAKEQRASALAVEALQNLKDGTATREDVGTIADMINARFSKLAAIWSKKFSAPASVAIFNTREHERDDDFVTTSLGFRRQDGGWRFTIDEVHCQDPEGESFSTIPFDTAPLLARVRAVSKLPQLRKALELARRRQGEEIAEAYDVLTEFVKAEVENARVAE